MEFIKTMFEDAWVIKPKMHRDNRGFFVESYTRKIFDSHGIQAEFVQDNHSMSVSAGVLRGMHFQRPPFTQSKLVRVISGAIFDVIVDLRKNSPTFGTGEGFTLTDEDAAMVFVPKGFAHGFCTLMPHTEVIYKVDEYYAPDHDCGIRWNDPNLNIKWPNTSPILSEKDTHLPFFKDFVSPF
ncbi:MAG TPA: dTDP-4-dehydrorhamnose 3,5-epimerase [Chitinivibrionales bacterium]